MHAPIRSFYHVARTQPTTPFCLVQAFVAATSSRHFASSSRARWPENSPAQPPQVTKAAEAAAAAAEAEPVGEDGGSGGRGTDGAAARLNYRQWLTQKALVWLLPNPRGGPNWLGVTEFEEGQDQYRTVFPKNVSFKPPTPLSNNDRDTIFVQWLAQPGDMKVRELSKRYGISLDRVNAIIKLKQYEKDWPEEMTLQTAFCDGMEKYLGVQSRSKVDESRHQQQREQQNEIDEDASYARATAGVSSQFKRVIWEMVGEGEEQIVSVEMAKEVEKRQQRLAKARRKMENLPTVRVPPAKPGRPSWAFVDVGDKFVDSRSREVQKKAQVFRGVLRRQEKLQGRAGTRPL